MKNCLLTIHAQLKSFSDFNYAHGIKFEVVKIIIDQLSISY